MKKIKIIIVGPDPNYKGGIATLIRNMLKYKNESCQFTMYVARPEGNILVKSLLVPIYTLYFIIRLIQVKYDIVHIHISENWGFYRYVPFVIISKMFGIPVIIHSNACEFDSFYERQNKIQKNIVKATLDKSDLIIAVSPEWNEVFSRISSTKVITIYNFIDIPNSNFYNKNSINILSSGQIGKRKGYYDIIKVIPSIIHDNNKIKFKFCGNGEVTKICEEINNLEISDYVNVSSWLHNSKIIELLKDTMIFLLPSYNEGMPLAILEAMSYGVPIISTNVGGIPTLVEHGVNGLIISPGDTKQLEYAINLLINDPDLRQKMSNNNYSKIKNEYSIQSNMKIIYEKYLDLTI